MFETRATHIDEQDFDSQERRASHNSTSRPCLRTADSWDSCRDTMIDYGTSQNVEQSRVDAQTIVGYSSKAVRIITATLDGMDEHLGLHSSMVHQHLINHMILFCV